jgi:hypothetical protein
MFLPKNNLFKICTGNPKWSAKTIADLYKSRWHIEVSFRSYQTIATNQNIHRHLQKCSYDTNLVCTHHYPLAQITQVCSRI